MSIERDRILGGEFALFSDTAADLREHAKLSAYNWAMSEPQLNDGDSLTRSKAYWLAKNVAHVDDPTGRTFSDDGSVPSAADYHAKMKKYCYSNNLDALKTKDLLEWEDICSRTTDEAELAAAIRAKKGSAERGETWSEMAERKGEAVVRLLEDSYELSTADAAMLTKAESDELAALKRECNLSMQKYMEEYRERTTKEFESLPENAKAVYLHGDRSLKRIAIEETDRETGLVKRREMIERPIPIEERNRLMKPLADKVSEIRGRLADRREVQNYESSLRKANFGAYYSVVAPSLTRKQKLIIDRAIAAESGMEREAVGDLLQSLAETNVKEASEVVPFLRMLQPKKDDVHGLSYWGEFAKQFALGLHGSSSGMVYDALRKIEGALYQGVHGADEYRRRNEIRSVMENAFSEEGIYLGVVANAFIGAASSALYGFLSAKTGGIGFAAIALAESQRLEDELVLQGVDTSGAKFAIESLASGFVYAGIERLQFDILEGMVLPKAMRVFARRLKSSANLVNWMADGTTRFVGEVLEEAEQAAPTSVVKSIARGESLQNTIAQAAGAMVSEGIESMPSMGALIGGGNVWQAAKAAHNNDFTETQVWQLGDVIAGEVARTNSRLSLQSEGSREFIQRLGDRFGNAIAAYRGYRRMNISGEDALKAMGLDDGAVDAGTISDALDKLLVDTKSEEALRKRLMGGVTEKSAVELVKQVFGDKVEIVENNDAKTKEVHFHLTNNATVVADITESVDLGTDYGDADFRNSLLTGINDKRKMEAAQRGEDPSKVELLSHSRIRIIVGTKKSVNQSTGEEETTFVEPSEEELSKYYKALAQANGFSVRGYNERSTTTLEFDDANGVHHKLAYDNNMKAEDGVKVQFLNEKGEVETIPEGALNIVLRSAIGVADESPTAVFHEYMHSIAALLATHSTGNEKSLYDAMSRAFAGGGNVVEGFDEEFAAVGFEKAMQKMFLRLQENGMVNFDVMKEGEHSFAWKFMEKLLSIIEGIGHRKQAAYEIEREETAMNNLFQYALSGDLSGIDGKDIGELTDVKEAGERKAVLEKLRVAEEEAQKKKEAEDAAEQQALAEEEDMRRRASEEASNVPTVETLESQQNVTFDSQVAAQNEQGQQVVDDGSIRVSTSQDTSSVADESDSQTTDSSESNVVTNPSNIAPDGGDMAPGVRIVKFGENGGTITIREEANNEQGERGLGDDFKGTIETSREIPHGRRYKRQAAKRNRKGEHLEQTMLRDMERREAKKQAERDVRDAERAAKQAAAEARERAYRVAHPTVFADGQASRLRKNGNTKVAVGIKEAESLLLGLRGGEYDISIDLQNAVDAFSDFCEIGHKDLSQFLKTKKMSHLSPMAKTLVRMFAANQNSSEDVWYALALYADMAGLEYDEDIKFELARERYVEDGVVKSRKKNPEGSTRRFVDAYSAKEAVWKAATEAIASEKLAKKMAEKAAKDVSRQKIRDGEQKAAEGLARLNGVPAEAIEVAKRIAKVQTERHVENGVIKTRGKTKKTQRYVEDGVVKERFLNGVVTSFDNRFAPSPEVIASRALDIDGDPKAHWITPKDSVLRKFGVNSMQQAAGLYINENGDFVFLGGVVIDPKKRTRVSARKMYDAKAKRDYWEPVFEDGLAPDGTEVCFVTKDYMRATPIGNLVAIAFADGRITAEQNEKQLQALADITNLCITFHADDLVWEVAGTELFSALKKNADPQYGTTIDFSTVCKKTEQVIRSASKVMADMKRGLTRSEIRDIVYNETRKAGEQAPCPFCYVYARWLGIGGVLDKMDRYQSWAVARLNDGRIGEYRYDPSNPSDPNTDTIYGQIAYVDYLVKEFYEGLDKEKQKQYTSKKGAIATGKVLSKLKENALKEGSYTVTNDDGTQTVVKGRGYSKLHEDYKEMHLKKAANKQMRNELEALEKNSGDNKERIASLKKAIQKNDEFIAELEENRATNEKLMLSSLDAVDVFARYQWMALVLCNESKDGRMTVDDSFEAVPRDLIFDLTRGAELAEKYPRTWKFRTSKGSALGKAIMPYTESEVGESIKGYGSGVESLEKGANPFALLLDKGQARFSGKQLRYQREAIAKAVAKMAAQNMIGGQRFQSTSDYRPDYSLDYFMELLALQAIGGQVQTYTKVVEAIRVLAGCGAEVNVSLMPRGKGYQDKVDPATGEVVRDENGNPVHELVFSPVTGLDADTAFREIAKYNNAQCILVGINDENIKLALADNRIMFVIPYHSSGNTADDIIAMMNILGEHIELKNREDYSIIQSDTVRESRTEEQKLAFSARTKILRGVGFTKEGKGSARHTILFTEEESAYLRDSNTFAAQALRKLHHEMYEDKSSSKYHAFLNAEQAEKIFPHEYWDTSLSFKDADENGRRFVQYCRDFGLVPRFEKFSNCKGYWKLLIDRSMYNKEYDEDGNWTGSYTDAHIPSAINVSSLSAAELSKDSETYREEYGTAVIKTADAKKTEGIAERSMIQIRDRRANKDAGASMNLDASAGDADDIIGYNRAMIREVMDNTARILSQDDAVYADEEDGEAADFSSGRAARSGGKKMRVGGDVSPEAILGETKRGVRKYCIGGPAAIKRAATVGDKNRLIEATVMEFDGASRRDILEKTGFFRGKDGAWRIALKAPKKIAPPEIDWYSLDYTTVYPASWFYDMTDIASKYPNASKLKVGRLRSFGGTSGLYVKPWYIMLSDEAFKTGTFVHELQHFIQYEEGFASSEGAAADDYGVTALSNSGLAKRIFGDVFDKEYAEYLKALAACNSIDLEEIQPVDEVRRAFLFSEAKELASCRNTLGHQARLLSSLIKGKSSIKTSSEENKITDVFLSAREHLLELGEQYEDKKTDAAHRVMAFVLDNDIYGARGIYDSFRKLLSPLNPDFPEEKIKAIAAMDTVHKVIYKANASEYEAELARNNVGRTDAEAIDAILEMLDRTDLFDVHVPSIRVSNRALFAEFKRRDILVSNGVYSNEQLYRDGRTMGRFRLPVRKFSIGGNGDTASLVADSTAVQGKNGVGVDVTRDVADIEDTSKLDGEFFDAVERGDMETAQRMTDEVAKRLGKVRLFHGSRQYGFTKFGTPLVFTTTDAVAADGYASAAGDEASAVRRLSDTLHEFDSDEHILQNAESVLGESWHKINDEDKQFFADTAISAVHKLQKRRDAALEAYNALVDEKALPASVEAEFQTYLDFANFSESEIENYGIEYLLKGFDTSAIDSVTDAHHHIRQFIWENEELFSRGDLAPLLEYALPSHIYDDYVDIYAAGKAFSENAVVRDDRSRTMPMKELAEAVQSASNVGVYALYGDTHNMVEVDAKGAWWQTIEHEGERYSTASLAEMFIKQGYDGVIIRNVVDPSKGALGTNAPITEYVYGNKNALKSADPITYDDDGNIIPLSKRFDKTKEDIRYSVGSKDSSLDIEGLRKAAERKRSNGWHGTAVTFKRFNNDMSHSGNGASAHGWGAYITTSRDEASAYATRAARFRANRFTPPESDRKYWKAVAKEEALKQEFAELLQANPSIQGEGSDEIIRKKRLVSEKLRKAEAAVAVLRKSAMKRAGVENERTILDVTFPADNGNNYIDYNRATPRSVRDDVARALKERGFELASEEDNSSNEDLGSPSTIHFKSQETGDDMTLQLESGGDLYKSLQKFVGNDFEGDPEKSVSAFLCGLGYDGMKYQNKQEEDVLNYVVFNDKRVQIVSRNKFSVDAQHKSLFEVIGRNRNDLDRTAIIRKFESWVDDVPKDEDYDKHVGEVAIKERIATHFICNGSLDLDEDGYRLDGVMKLVLDCRLTEEETMRYSSATELLNDFAEPEHLDGRKAVDPDKEPMFTNRKEMDDGVVVYDVDDSIHGLRAVRRVVDTHLGKDKNPWNFVARVDGSTKNAESLWVGYSDSPKRIAFQNGKLLAFCASTESDIDDRDGAWHREDVGYGFSSEADVQTYVEGKEWTDKENGGVAIPSDELYLDIMNEGEAILFRKASRQGRSDTPIQKFHFGENSDKQIWWDVNDIRRSSLKEIACDATFVQDSIDARRKPMTDRERDASLGDTIMSAYRNNYRLVRAALSREMKEKACSKRCPFKAADDYRGGLRLEARLGDIVYGKALFDAYPKTADIKVVVATRKAELPLGHPVGFNDKGELLVWKDYFNRDIPSVLSSAKKGVKKELLLSERGMLYALDEVSGELIKRSKDFGVTAEALENAFIADLLYCETKSDSLVDKAVDLFKKLQELEAEEHSSQYEIKLLRNELGETLRSAIKLRRDICSSKENRALFKDRVMRLVDEETMKEAEIPTEVVSEQESTLKKRRDGLYAQLDSVSKEAEYAEEHGNGDCWEMYHEAEMIHELAKATETDLEALKSVAQSSGKKFSVAGEKGILALGDKEAINALLVAKRMKTNGNTPREIKDATFWEEGADGLWRYEIPDIKLKDGWRDAKTLADAVDAPELLKAYPALSLIRLDQNVSSKRTAGVYDDSKKTIRIRGGETESTTRSTLIHEIQHAIQAIEGFARGGDSIGLVSTILRHLPRGAEFEKMDGFADLASRFSRVAVIAPENIHNTVRFNRGYSTRLGVAKYYVSEMKTRYPEFISLVKVVSDAEKVDGLRRRIDEMRFKAGSDGADTDFIQSHAQELQNQIDKILYGYDSSEELEATRKDAEEWNLRGDVTEGNIRAVNKAFRDALVTISAMRKGELGSPERAQYEAYEKRRKELNKITRNPLGSRLLYESIAGEVEARSADKRANMGIPFEERRKMMFSETEDYDRDEQIVLLDDNRATGGQSNETPATFAEAVEGHITEEDVSDMMKYSVGSLGNSRNYTDESYVVAIMIQDKLAGIDRPDDDYEKLGRVLGAHMGVQEMKLVAEEATKEFDEKLNRSTFKKLTAEERVKGTAELVEKKIAPKKIQKALSKATAFGATIGKKSGESWQRFLKGLANLMPDVDINTVNQDMGIDIAKTIARINPATFNPEQAPYAPRETKPSAKKTTDTHAETRFREGVGEVEETQPIAIDDDGVVSVNQMSVEQEAKLTALVEAAKAEVQKKREEAKKRREKREEAKRLAALSNSTETHEPQAAQATSSEADDGGEIDDLEDNEGIDPIVLSPRFLAEHNVDLTDAHQFAAFFKYWFLDYYQRTMDKNTVSDADKTAKVINSTAFLDAYKKATIAQLSSLAKGMIAQRTGSKALLAIERAMKTLSLQKTQVQIQNHAVTVLKKIQASAIKESQKQLVKEISQYIHEQAEKGKEFDAMEKSTNRLVLGEHEHMARFVKKCIDMTRKQVADTMTELSEQLEKAVKATDDTAGVKGAETDYAKLRDVHLIHEKVQLLNLYGGLKYRMPSDIMAAKADIEEWLGTARKEHLEKLEKIEQDNEYMAKALYDAMVASERSTGAKDPSWLHRATISSIGQRLDEMTVAATPEQRAAIGKIRTMLNEGAVKFSVLKNRYRKELEDAIIRSTNGTGITPKQLLAKLKQPVPDELRSVLTRNTKTTSLTWGQALQLYSSLLQTYSFAGNIEANGRQGQAKLIAEHADSSMLALVDNLREIYESRRESLSEAMTNLTGMGVYNPDPMYMKSSMDNGVFDGSGGRKNGWNVVDKCLTPRVKNTRDFDLSATLLGEYEESCQATARAIAYGECGLVLSSVIRRKDVLTQMTRTAGSKATRDFLEHIVDCISGEQIFDEKLRFLSTLSSLATQQALAFNATSSAKQLLSIPAWVMCLDGGLVEFTKSLSSFSFEYMDMLCKHPGFEARYGGKSFAKMFAEPFADKTRGNFYTKLLASGMTPMQICDFAASMAVGVGFFKARIKILENANPEMDHKEIEKLAADETWTKIDEIMQAARVENTPLVLRRFGILGKQAHKFATSPLQQLSWFLHLKKMRSEAIAAGDKEKSAYYTKRMLSSLVVNHLILPPLMQLATDLMSTALGDPPEKEEFLGDLLLNCLLGSFDRVFILGSIMQRAIGRVINGVTNLHATTYSSDTFPVASMMDRLVTESIDTIIAILERDGDAFKKEIMDALGTAFAPANYAKRYMRNHGMIGTTKKRPKKLGASAYSSL